MRYYTEKDEERLMKELRYYAEKMIELCDHYDKTGEICEIKLLSSDPAVPYLIKSNNGNIKTVIAVALILKYDKKCIKLKNFYKEELYDLYKYSQNEVALFLKSEDTEDKFYESKIEECLKETWIDGIAHARYMEETYEYLSGKIDIPNQECPWSVSDLIERDIDELMKGLI